jgi:HK97 family phage prohead protease
MPALEYRRAEALRSDGRTLFGIAAPYDRPAEIGSFREVISRGAFARVLRERNDVLLLRDHDMASLLARVSNGSLALSDGQDGLSFRAELAAFTLADDTLAQVRSGLLAGMSIGFFVRSERWSAQRDQRTLDDVELVEISAVGPAVAYDGTSIAARAKPRINPRFSASEIARRRRRRQLAGL